MRLLFQLLLAGIFSPLGKSSKPEHFVMCQLIHEFRSKEVKKITALFLMLLKHSTLRYQKCCMFSITKYFALLQAIHECLKNKQNHGRVYWVFSEFFCHGEGKRGHTFPLCCNLECKQDSKYQTDFATEFLFSQVILCLALFY